MRFKLSRFLGPLLGIVLFSLALWVLVRELRGYRYADVARAVLDVPWTGIAAAIGLTILNYVVLTGYDALALRGIGRAIAYRRVALVSFLSYAFSQGLGFPLLTGAPVRYRLYSLWGLSAVEVTAVIAFSSLTFLLGLFAVGGTAFVLHPFPLPAGLGIPVPPVGWLGALLVAAVIGYVAFSVIRTEPIRFRGWEFQAPAGRLTLAQLVLSSIDWTVAAGVLYVLLPKLPGVGFGMVLEIFLLGQFIGLISQVPGGIGILEAVFLLLLPAAEEHRVLAGLLVYRIVYYLLPLVSAAVTLAVHEALQHREEVRKATQRVAGWVPMLAPQLLAATTFIAGAVLVLSGATPAVHGRLRFLNEILPLGVIEASHFFGSLAGLGLLFLARGIQRRLDAAYHLSVILLLAGVAFSLLKGLDYEEATFLTMLLLVLASARREFYRKTSLTSETFTPQWTAAILVVLLASVWAGLFAFKHVEYTSELWWRFALTGDAPRFLRATFGLTFAALAIATARLLRPAAPEPTLPGCDELGRAAAIARDAPLASAHLALVGDKELLFSDTGDAFLMYGIAGRSWIAMGDPIGPDQERAELVWRFRELVDRHGGWPAFYQVRPDALPLYLELGLTLTKVGEEARVELGGFSLEGGKRRGMRKVVNRLEKQVDFEILSAGDGVAAEMEALRRVSDNWLAHRATAEKGFSLGRFDEDYLLRCGPVAVVRRDDGTIVAFSNLWAPTDREELSVDLMRYSDDAPESVMEYLFVQIMLWGKAEGYRWFNLGMAPLAGIEARRLAPLWSRIAALVFRHGDPFYGFQGLRQYKEKFDPVWEPRYLASPGGLALPGVLTGIAALISGGLKGVVTK